MQTQIYHAFIKALAVALLASIVAVGAFAIHLTHVTASVTITFGDAMPQQVAMADALNISQLIPLPTRKPKVSK